MTADAIREAGGWRRGKEWRRSRRQAAPVTGPAGRENPCRDREQG